MLTGLLDVATLTRVPSAQHLRLTSDAAAGWERLADAVLARYPWRPTLTDAYRDYAAQEALFRKRYTTTKLQGRPTKTWHGVVWYLRPGYATAAVPGTSNHGRGDTVDVAWLGGYGSQRFRQFASVAAEHGWSNREGAKIGEPWHWQRIAADDRHATPPTPATEPAPTPEDDVTDLIRTMLRAYLYAEPTDLQVIDWAIKTHGWTPDQILAAVLHQPATARTLDVAYRLHLHRAPDTAAASWLEKGMTVDGLLDAIKAAAAAGAR